MVRVATSRAPPRSPSPRLVAIGTAQSTPAAQRPFSPDDLEDLELPSPGVAGGLSRLSGGTSSYLASTKIPSPPNVPRSPPLHLVKRLPLPRPATAPPGAMGMRVCGNSCSSPSAPAPVSDGAPCPSCARLLKELEVLKQRYTSLEFEKAALEQVMRKLSPKFNGSLRPNESSPEIATLDAAVWPHSTALVLALTYSPHHEPAWSTLSPGLLKPCCLISEALLILADG